MNKEQQLREAWLIESKNVGANIPSYVADWWLSARTKELEELRKSIEEIRVFYPEIESDQFDAGSRQFRDNALSLISNLH